MLSNLASYLGYAASASKTSQEEKAPGDMRFRAVEEDEWVLVDRNENENETSILRKETDEDAEMTRVTLGISTCPNTSPESSKPISRSASLDVLNPLQESWYLTPPPSFTSKGPIHMETSPLENLLIEHPSMSVYEHTQRTDTASGKMSNSSPSSGAKIEENHSAVLLPIKERMYKLPRNKLNSTKLAKKQTSNSSSSSTSQVPAETETQSESKETKMKSFVKSPRRSMNVEMENIPKKALRKRSNNSGTPGMISKNNARNDVIREETTVQIVPVLPPRRLYSEVLGTKQISEPTVQTPKSVVPQPSEPVKKPDILEPVPETAQEPPAPLSEESVMSVEESSDEMSMRPDDREEHTRAVQTTLPDRQNRLLSLNRSAQKVRVLSLIPSNV